MAMTYGNTSLLRRSQLWSTELKEILQDQLLNQNVVRWLTDFPEGETLNIPSIGEATVRNYTENTPVVYDALDTGNFTFDITEYIQAGTFITEKARQDAYYAAELEASFVPKQARALQEYTETQVLGLAAAGSNGGQTVSDANSINGAAHRYVASGTTTANEIAIGVKDFSKALFALKKANVPDQALVAIVDPSVEYTINNLSNLIIPGASTAPMWGDLFQSGVAAGPRFVRNIFGFDVYVSNYLPAAGASGNEFSVSDGGSGVCNIFYSAWDQRNLPFIGAWRQAPKVDAEYNKDLQREEYVTTARFGKKVYRLENLVVVVSSTDVIV